MNQFPAGGRLIVAALFLIMAVGLVAPQLSLAGDGGVPFPPVEIVPDTTAVVPDTTLPSAPTSSEPSGPPVLDTILLVLALL